MLTLCDSVVNYLTVIAHASETFNVARQAPSSSTWLTEFARSKPEINHKAHKIASLVSLMSASIRNGQPLPPYLKTPSKFHLSEQIEGTGNILALSNLNEPGFRELAVMELAHKCLVDSVDTILGLVKDLVGEVDFSYHVVNNSAAMSSSGLGENVEGKQKSH
jgi:hypothetical protein